MKRPKLTLEERKNNCKKRILDLENKIEEVESNENFEVPVLVKKAYTFYKNYLEKNIELPNAMKGKEYQNEKNFYIKFSLNSRLNFLREEYDRLNSIKHSPYRQNK